MREEVQSYRVNQEVSTEYNAGKECGNLREFF